MMPPISARIDLDTLARRVVQGLDKRSQIAPRQYSTRINTQQNGVPITNRHRVINVRSSGVGVVASDTNHRADLAIPAGYLLCVVDGGGQPIAASTTPQSSIHIHDNLTVVQWTIVADRPGAITLDFKSCPFANYPSTTSITGGAGIALAGAQAAKSPDYIDPITGVLSTTWAALGWTSLAIDNIMDVVVLASVTVQRVTITLQCQGF